MGVAKIIVAIKLDQVAENLRADDFRESESRPFSSSFIRILLEDETL